MKEEIEKIMEVKYIIVLDSSVYLNIYEYSPDIGKVFLDILEEIKEDIYIPSTVKREVERNYRGCFSKQKNKFLDIPKNFKTTIENAERQISNKINILEKFKFPNTGIIKNNIKDKINEITEIFKNYVEEHDVFQETNDSLFSEDKVFKFFENNCKTDKLLKELSIDEIYLICQEGAERYRKKDPPGFEDDKDKKKQGIDKYNDLIIWKELLKFCKENASNLIFITDDLKEDWWELEESQRIFHRKLVAEFSKNTRKKVIALNSEEFYLNMSEILNIEIPDKFSFILKYSAKDFIENITENIELEILEKLMYSGERYVDTSTLTGYDGTFFEMDEEFRSIKLNNFQFLGHEDSEAKYSLTYDIKIDAISKNYWGRDDETKDVILSDNHITHNLKGKVEIEIIRKINSYLEDLSNSDDYILENIDIELSGYDYYDSNDLCIECGGKMGVYWNSDNEPICENCMVDDRDGFVCPECGRKCSHEEASGDGFCRECSSQKD